MKDGDVPHMPRRNKEADDPKMIGLWKIGRTIGKGSSGRVRIARHSKTGQYAAIKIVSKSCLLNSRTEELQDAGDQADRILLGIEREIVIMKLIDHPNIMRLYDVWETSTELYLVLEYVEGGELFDYLCSKGRLSTTEALKYFQQIIIAIDYCHRFNIAHRDLKPENLLLDANKNIKVADFGMAAWQANANNGLLQTACGSPHYAAPEVIMGHAYNGSQSDIWSCGVILFALLAGRLPFDDEDLHALLEKVKYGVYDTPTDIDPLARDLISKMLQKDIAKRITIPQILKHPFFTSQKPTGTAATMPNLDDIARPIGSILEIDPDIFANLLTLWHGVPEAEITESLKNNEQTWQKGVYHLLIEYRAKHMENYDEDEEAHARRSKRRSKKKATGKEATDLGRSNTSIPPRCDPPTPRRAGRNNDAPDADRLNVIQPPRLTFHSPSPDASRDHSNSPVPPASPLSPIWDALNLPPLDVPEMHDDKIQQFFHQIVDHLNAIEVRTPLAGESLASPHERHRGHYNDAATPPPTPLDGTIRRQPPHHPNGPRDRVNYKNGSIGSTRTGQSQRSDSFGLGLSSDSVTTRPLSIRRRVTPAALKLFSRGNVDKENNGGYRIAAQGIGIVKKSSLRVRGAYTEDAVLGNRRVQIVMPPETEHAKLRRRRSLDPQLGVSPSLSVSDDSSFVGSPATPRRSWFNNVFKFKPTRYQLFSVHDAYTSREECRRILVGLGVQVVLTHAESAGILKCKMDEVNDPAGAMAVFKAVRFRVEVHKPSPSQVAAGFQVVLHLVQEKGAMSSFGSVYSRLRRDWDLDVQQQQDVGGPSPAFSDAGRFVETVYAV
ncbi:hypothetical protein PLICRDRAFT_112541 [Plicaturopsis crispa FD-325 SS-3]|nr:hypothetical protein PLICRDRAFT_112541 [Plicaturopsis crispa FD-325 SS-3]